MQSTATTILVYLFGSLALLAIPVWCGALYHFLRFQRAWRQEGSPARPYFALFAPNLPEPCRTHRKRLLQVVAAFTILNALAWFLVLLGGLLHG
jgi:hypothetical protein